LGFVFLGTEDDVCDVSMDNAFSVRINTFPPGIGHLPLQIGFKGHILQEKPAFISLKYPIESRIEIRSCEASKLIPASFDKVWYSMNPFDSILRMALNLFLSFTMFMASFTSLTSHPSSLFPNKWYMELYCVCSNKICNLFWH
jgi:hypothetical protein